jgi:hypothetical protein
MASAKQELLGRYLDHLRGEDRLLGNDLRSEPSPNPDGRQEARRILDKAAQDKKLSRTDLKRAINLYAGRQATDKERAAVGSKMLDFLTKKEIKLTA